MRIGGLQKLTLLDYPGKVACTVFLSGCNLRCPYCHNPGLVLPEQSEGSEIPEAEVLSFLERRKGKLDGVCITGGEPTLQLELPDEELPVYADPNMMQRALHNLLGNAMHHIGKDGIFILRAQRCTEGVRIEVEDHGPGISADDLPYIFDRYYRSRSDAGKQGTGLGLSITKAIFQQHGFRFGVQSAIGMGTTFWFIMNDLPANAAEMAGQDNQE